MALTAGTRNNQRHQLPTHRREQVRTSSIVSEVEHFAQLIIRMFDRGGSAGHVALHST